jgi:hypothetical protein
MAITQVDTGLGNWSLQLQADTPRELLTRLRYLGHICVTAGRDDPRVAGDSLLADARYVGPLRAVSFATTGFTLSGVGMAYWLGDEDAKGDVLESAVVLTGATFVNAVRALLPDAVAEGTLTAVAGTITSTFQYQTRRTALDYVVQTMGGAYRVNGDGTLDAGPLDSLYYTTPRAAIIRRKQGVDLALRALPGTTQLDEDINDFTTRVVLYSADTDGNLTPSASANIDPDLNPFRDLFGNPVKIVRLSQETTTDPATAPARAQLELNRYSAQRDAVTLASSQYDITGDLQVGDSVWVFDPDTSLWDPTGINEVVFQGERINPVKLVVNQLTWPIVAGMGVSFRDPNGNWYDLTDYVLWEQGDTQIVVGGYDRSLIAASGGAISTGTPVGPNVSVPNAPAFVLPFEQSVYQSVNSTITRAQILVDWTRPTNTDGSPYGDGAIYEVRYRQSASTGGYQYVRTSYFDTTAVLIQELTVGVEYSFEIRTCDTGVPANYSAWSDPELVITGNDDIGPGTPAAPEVAASRIAVQVVHRLGLSTGGEFNLPADMHHLKIHLGTSSGFTCTDDNLAGKLPATINMLMAETPIVGTFPVESTAPVFVKVIAVDEAGNESGSSAAASATAELIDDAHISELTVSKITGGTISSDWIVGANITTAASGQRAGLDPSGFFAYDPDEVKTFEVDAATGIVSVTGSIRTADVSREVVVGEGTDGLPRVSWYDPDAPDGLTNISAFASGGQFSIARFRNSDGAQTGGVILYQATGSYYAHVSPGFAQFLGISLNDGIHFQGHFGWIANSQIGKMTGYEFLGPAITLVVISYGATQSRARCIQVTSHDTVGPNIGFVTANTSTSFTIRPSVIRSNYLFYESTGV